MNSIRQLEQKLEASQETIIDQLKTIEKFRDLVRHLQVRGTFVGVVYCGRGLLQTDLTELRKQPKEEQEEEESVSSISSSETMLSQLKTSSAIQAYSRV